MADPAIRTGVRKLVGIAHADQVGGEAAAKADAVREDVAPDVRTGRIPMQEYNRVARPEIDIGHFPAENFDEFTEAPPLRGPTRWCADVRTGGVFRCIVKTNTGRRL